MNLWHEIAKDMLALLMLGSAKSTCAAVVVIGWLRVDPSKWRTQLHSAELFFRSLLRNHSFWIAKTPFAFELKS